MPSKHNVKRHPRGKQLCVWIEHDTFALLKTILDRDGVPYNRQLERAIRLWAATKGLTVAMTERAS